MEAALIGEIVNSNPALLPERVILKGRYITIEPICPDKHADSINEEIPANAYQLWYYTYQVIPTQIKRLFTRGSKV